MREGSSYSLRRLFKLSDLEKDCEDYGQAVIYNGNISSLPLSFTLDIEHTIEKGKVFSPLFPQEISEFERVYIADLFSSFFRRCSQCVAIRSKC